MTNITNLRVFEDSIEFVRLIHALKVGRGYGDLVNQLRRAAVSVGSNIAEGAGLGSDAGFVRHLKIARGSVNEAEAQLNMLQAIGLIQAEGEVIELSRAIGKQLTRLIQYLDGGGG